MALNPFDIAGSDAAILSATIPSTAGAYTAAENVGGKLTFANAVRVAGGTLRLQSLLLVDLANQKIIGDLYIYDSDPSLSTFTDNGVNTIHATDLPRLIHKIPIVAADYTTVDSKGIACIPLYGRVLKAAAGGTSLYATFVTGGTPTYGTTGLLLQLGVIRD